MRALTTKLSPSNLFSCFKETADAKQMLPADIDTNAIRSTSKISSKNRLFVRLGLLPPSKPVNSRASTSNAKQVSAPVTINKRSPSFEDVHFDSAYSQPKLAAQTAQSAGSKLQHENSAGYRRQLLQRTTINPGFVDSARASAKEKEILLNLRFAILKLPTDLNIQCNANLAEILKTKHPGQRIEMLERLLPKISGQFSGKSSPNTLVMTSFQGVVTEMSRKKSEEVTAMRTDLLNLNDSRAISYQHLLRDVLARPNSKKRDDLLTEMAQEIKRNSVDNARASAKEKEILLNLRFAILKLPTDLNIRCNTTLAKILNTRPPEQRIEMMERLLSKISGQFSGKSSPNAVVLTSFRGVVTEMSRKKLDEVTAMRMDLLKLRGPRATSYRNLLQDVLKRPHSEERDNLLTRMNEDIKAHLA